MCPKEIIRGVVKMHVCFGVLSIKAKLEINYVLDRRG